MHSKLSHASKEGRRKEVNRARINYPILRCGREKSKIGIRAVFFPASLAFYLHLREELIILSSYLLPVSQVIKTASIL